MGVGDQGFTARSHYLSKTVGRVALWLLVFLIHRNKSRPHPNRAQTIPTGRVAGGVHRGYNGGSALPPTEPRPCPRAKPRPRPPLGLPGLVRAAPPAPVLLDVSLEGVPPYLVSSAPRHRPRCSSMYPSRACPKASTPPGCAYLEQSRKTAHGHANGQFDFVWLPARVPHVGPQHMCLTA